MLELQKIKGNSFISRYIFLISFILSHILYSNQSINIAFVDVATNSVTTALFVANFVDAAAVACF
jgi:hypothetical protein